MLALSLYITCLLRTCAVCKHGVLLHVLIVILLSSTLSLPLIAGQSVVVSEATTNNPHDTLFLCMITREDAAPIRCVSATINVFDPSATHNASLMTIPPTLPPMNLSSPRPLQLTATNNFACALRDDHSLVCFDPISDVISTFNETCPFDRNATYKCGIGRRGRDGIGWIGSPFGYTGAAEEARGFSYVSVSFDVRNRKYAVLALTYPERFPTLYGTTNELQQKWNFAANPQFKTHRMCVSPIAIAHETLHNVRSLPVVALDNILHTSMDAVCGGIDLTYCALISDSKRIVCWSVGIESEAQSPPSFIRFSSLSCGLSSGADVVLHNLDVCGIIANPSIAGRILCWASEDRLVAHLYWSLVEILAAADPAVQAEMFDEWRNDASPAGHASCMLKAQVQPTSSFLTRRSFDASPGGSDIRSLSAAPIISTSCSSIISGAFICCTYTSLDSSNCFYDLAVSINNRLTALTSSPLTQQFRNTKLINAVNVFAYSYARPFSQWLNAHWAIGEDDTQKNNYLYIWGVDPASAVTSNIKSLAYTLQTAVATETYTSVITYADCMYGINDASVSNGVSNIDKWEFQLTTCPNTLTNHSLHAVDFVNTQKQIRRIVFGSAVVSTIVDQTPFTVERFNRASNLYEWVLVPAIRTDAYYDVLPPRIRQKTAIAYQSRPIARYQMFVLLEGDEDIANAHNVPEDSAWQFSNFFTVGNMDVEPSKNLYYHGVIQAGRMPASFWNDSSKGIGANKTRWDDIVVNKNFLCGLNVNKSVHCWGDEFVVGWHVRIEWQGKTRTYMYGNGHDDEHLNVAAYTVFSPPTAFAPYKAICATILYACAITNSSTVLCWMGPYDQGRLMTMFHVDVDFSPNVTENVLGDLQMDDSVIGNQTFTAITCADLMVCGLTTSGRIYCSAPPLTRVRYRQSFNDISLPESAIIYPPPPIVPAAESEGSDSTIVHLATLGEMYYVSKGEQWVQPVCYVRRNGHAECVSNGALIRPLSTVTALAPRGYYRLAGGTEIFQCPGSTYSRSVGASSAACSGPCAAGYAGSSNSNVSLTFTNETCNNACPVGHYCPLGNDGPIPCPAGWYGNVSGLSTSACSGRCGIGTYCPSGSHQPLDCPAGTYGEDVGLSTELCSGMCPPTTAAPTSGSRVCMTCPVNTYSMSNGSTHCRSCLTNINGLICADGIARVDSYHHASVIVERSNSTRSGISLVLETVQCPLGYCNGTNSSRIDTDRIEQYRRSNMSAPIQLALLKQCTDNRVQSSQSVLCGRCVEGHAPSDIGSIDSGCVACTGVNAGKMTLFILIPFLFTLLYYIAANGRLGALGQILYFFQTIAIMVSSQSKLSSALNFFNIRPWTLWEIHSCLAPMPPELQYALPLFVPIMQIIYLVLIIGIQTSMKHVVRQFEWETHYKLDMMSMTYVKVNELASYEEPSDNVPQSRRHLFRVMMWFCFWPEVSVSTITRTVILIFMSSLTSVISTSVNWFSCFKTDESNVNWGFPAIECETPTYTAWSIFFAAHILFWALTILSIGLWLFVNSSKLVAIQSVTLRNVTATSSIHPISVSDGAQDNMNRTIGSVVIPTSSRPSGMANASLNINDNARIVGGSAVPLSVKRIKPFAVVALRPQYGTDEEVEGRLFVPLIGWLKWSWFWPAFTAFDDAAPCPDNLLDQPVCVSQTSMRLETRRQYAFRAVYGGLFDAFTEDAIAWNTMILLRRWAIIILAVYFKEEEYASVKYLSFAILHGVIYALHTYYQPYAIKIMNGVEQAGIVVHIVIAGILCAFPIINNPTVQTVIIAITISSVVTALLLVAAHHFGIQYIFTTAPNSSQQQSRSTRTANSHFVTQAATASPSSDSSLPTSTSSHAAHSSADANDASRTSHRRLRSELTAGLLSGMSDDDAKSSGSGERRLHSDQIEPRRTSLSRLLGLNHSTPQSEALEMKSLTPEQERA